MIYVLYVVCGIIGVAVLGAVISRLTEKPIPPLEVETIERPLKQRFTETVMDDGTTFLKVETPTYLIPKDASSGLRSYYLDSPHDMLFRYDNNIMGMAEQSVFIGSYKDWVCNKTMEQVFDVSPSQDKVFYTITRIEECHMGSMVKIDIIKSD